MTPAYLQLRDPTVPIVWGLSALLGAGFPLFVLLYCLLQPTQYQNLGMAVYKAPPGTRVEPAPPQMNAPALAELVAEYGGAFALDYGMEKPIKVEKPVKRVSDPPKPRSRRYYRGPRSDYARQSRGRHRPHRRY
jgi:hypothetical protein